MLKLFGAASIEAADGPVTGRAAQGRRLALLSLLALARGRSVTRDKVVALLWPESPTERARHQLSDDLYIVRSALGEDVIRSVGDELALNPDVISSDAGTFERLLDEGRPEAAVELVTGPLLDGFHLADGGEFDRWLDSERARLGERYAAALESLAESREARAEFGEAVGWWRRLAGHDPYNGRVALRLMRALEGAGDRAGALRHARIHTTLLREEFDAQPDPDVAAFAERLRVEPPARSAPESVADRPATRAADTSGAVPANEGATPAASERTGTGASEATVAPSIVQPPTAGKSRVSRYFVVAALAIALTVVGGLIVAAPRLAAPPRPPPHASSVAVLPFLNMSSDPENAYFSDGLSEQIIAALSRIEGLQIAARTSSFALRDGKLDVRAIGDTLGVSAVLEGSVRREGDRLRITAQLIDATTGYHIWTDEYDRDLRGIFTLQDEIATAIAEALELRLARGGAPSAPRPPLDLEAYDLYLRGLHLRNSLAPDALRRAAALFDRAIAREPGFALAYAAKASVVAPLMLFAGYPQEQGVPEMRTLTARALELDPNLGEAYASRGIVVLFFEWDWEGAERALRRAIELNPSDAHAYHHLANYLRVMGRVEEMVVARRRAVDLDPLNARTIYVLAADYLVAGNYDRALEEYERAMKLDPGHLLAVGATPWLPAGPSLVYLRQGRYEEAVEEYVRIAALRGASARELDALRTAFATSGMPGFWRRWMDVDTRLMRGAPDPLLRAQLWTLAGDTAQAVRWLDRAYAKRHPALIYLNSDPNLEVLRAHPRTVQILKEMKFPGR